MSGPDALLRVEGLEIELGGRPVLRGASLEVGPGEVVGLVGPNGAGKTTLVRAASGVLPVARGKVLVGGRPLSEHTPRSLAQQTAVVPQDTGVPFPFSAGELVVMGRAPHQPLLGLDSRADVARARAALERLGIAHLADRSVFELSGGERQLVAFARALAQDARLLLLDEPTAFLDLRHRALVLRIVREQAATGRGALVVSHDLNLAARSCDRLVVLVDGAAIASGAPSEVLTPALLADAYGVEADVLTAPDGSPVAVPRL